MSKSALHLIIAGQVDHGKSTLIGRLLYETGSLSAAQVAAMEKASKKRGSEMEWAFVLDSLQLERTQGITLDTTRVWLKRPMRDVVLIDAPGHHELLANMLTGAARADAAIVLIDAVEGVTPQTQKHLELLAMLGIEQVCCVINKMDAVEYQAAHFKALADHLQTLTGRAYTLIPVSARYGDNLSQPSPKMEWYTGDTLLAHMDRLFARGMQSEQPFRMSVQHVARVGEQRIITGNIASGTLSVGDALYFSPSGSVSILKAFADADGEASASKTSAEAGEAVGLLLGQPVFCDRGEVLSHVKTPPMWVTTLPATLVWLAQTPAYAGDALIIRIGTQQWEAVLEQLAGDTLKQHEMAAVTLKIRGYAVVDTPERCLPLSRFILCHTTGAVLAAGFVQAENLVDARPTHAAHKSEHISPFGQPITTAMFEARNSHKGGIFWFTGLSGSGKSTLAIELQKLLFARGRQVMMLDGDNLRHGLTRDLGFSSADRRENIRRAAEVAALCAQNGMIVLTAFITPTEADRELARSACPERFHLIYNATPLSLCETRDSKGLYALARQGKIAEFTGISAPFETPAHADVTVDGSQPLDDCLHQLLAYIERHTAL